MQRPGGNEGCHDPFPYLEAASQGDAGENARSGRRSVDTSTAVVHCGTSPPLDRTVGAQQKSRSDPRSGGEEDRPARGVSIGLYVRGLAPYVVELAGSAALDPALIRRGLVTHWGLSTFPGSGIFSYGRLT
jgi:hypothetical protein